MTSKISSSDHTLQYWLRDRAILSGNKTAVDDRGVKTSFITLAERASNLAQKLRLAGLNKGDRIVTITGNSVDQIVLFFACAEAGLVLCPLSWRFTAAELAEIVDRVRPSLVAFEDEYSTLAREAVQGSVQQGSVRQGSVPMVLMGEKGIEDAVPQIEPVAAGALHVPPPVDDDPLLMIFTSGSEAKPKGVVLTHANCFWNNLSLGEASGIGPNDTALCILPQFHIGGWNIYPLLAIKVGATLVLERTFQPGRVLELIRERKVTIMMGVPTQYQMLASADGFANADLSSLRLAQVGGSPANQHLVEAWSTKGITLSPGYGLTEASPNVLFTPQRADITGMTPYPHVRVRIDSKSGVEGELQISGPGVFSGYLNDRTATANAFTTDGWLRSGDIAKLDPRGGIHIVGRIKEIYITGGENVAPAEVEQVLLRHPLVKNSAVVGMPDPVWGEVGCAFIELAEAALQKEATNIENILITAIAKQLAPFKVPKRIIVLDAIPLIGIDKAHRVRLKEMAMRLSAGVSVE